LQAKARSVIHRGVPSYITPEGFARLQEEADRLWRVERPRVTREVADAAALGDRSENAEYIYGKRRLREIDARLRFLARRMDELTVVRATPEQRGRVFFGAFVTLEEEDGARRELRLVGPDESDPAAGRISIESPLGRALLGKREGDELLVRRPKGDLHATIVAIRYEEA
jgi:transcription elongation factor GreB